MTVGTAGRFCWFFVGMLSLIFFSIYTTNILFVFLFAFCQNKKRRKKSFVVFFFAHSNVLFILSSLFIRCKPCTHNQQSSDLDILFSFRSSFPFSFYIGLCVPRGCSCCFFRCANIAQTNEEIETISKNKRSWRKALSSNSRINRRMKQTKFIYINIIYWYIT